MSYHTFSTFTEQIRNKKGLPIRQPSVYYLTVINPSGSTVKSGLSAIVPSSFK